MALGTPTLEARQGQTTLRPNFITYLQFVGDDAYATGGTADFNAFVGAALGINATVSAVSGYGKTAGVVTHLLEYDASEDKLLVYVLSTGAQAADAADLSGVTFDAIVTHH